MKERILFVDDDLNLLNAFKRTLHNQYDIHIAEDGMKGLKIIRSESPFALVISDFRMPGMDGIKFLAKVRELEPDTVRVMLTGYADLDSAIEVVNKGRIFRFLTKPCPIEQLSGTIEDAIKQYHLIHAEKELLEKTLSGSIRVLTEILSLVNPIAFSRALRVQSYVNDIIRYLKIKDGWQIRIAALLSHIGCITLPPHLLEKVIKGETLTKKEAGLYYSHPKVGKELIEKIPRLDITAMIIENQLSNYQDHAGIIRNGKYPIEYLGGDILRVVIEYDHILLSGKTKTQVIQELRKNDIAFNPKIVEALAETVADIREKKIFKVYLAELRPGMVLQDHIRAEKSGMMIAAKGQVVSKLMVERLKAFADSVGIEEPIYVTR